ncbi:DUF72 domain-containing protein [Saccharolobus solfataricus]|nr:DUF72 domain-containing protein [Saccharolobus solfataricus]AKA73756.1 DUF72 domain-containing protein [Saccharolobus solfataricus]AKA76453.1 DUF72 domain-containing protein [Saccharolobus solfataricus]AKA79146.1 DUF72 domain-containing protein [Saccharolobus solfataricus]AZF68229.1 DUF72 domain-containing protein [Saccharolobus solfataricus]AZF70849.1 DUF72 domain-containing protein [Saccharolobus solfataricus]
MIKIGTCGFTRKHFNYFDVLEVQETFYNFLSEERLNKLKELSIRNKVELTIKANQIITHEYNRITYKRFKKIIGDVKNYGYFRPTKEVMQALEITLNEAKFLNSRIIIFQTPPSFAPNNENIKNLKDFFSILDKSFIYGWEPRGEWNQNHEVLLKIFSQIDVIHVVDPFKNKSVDDKQIRYFRLHGLGSSEVNYRYKYTKADLEKLKEYVLSERKELIYVLFNNVYSFDDALSFKRMIEG